MKDGKYENGDIFRLRDTHDYLVVRVVRKKYYVVGYTVYVLENARTKRYTKPMTKKSVDKWLDIVEDPTVIRKIRIRISQDNVENILYGTLSMEEEYAEKYDPLVEKD